MLQKYAPALLPLLLTIVGAFVLLPRDAFTNVTDMSQFAILSLGAIATFAVPLAKGNWAGLFKTGIAILIAIITALTPLLISQDYTPQAIGLIVLAALNALATEIGVGVRVDAAKKQIDAIADPNTGVYTITDLPAAALPQVKSVDAVVSDLAASNIAPAGPPADSDLLPAT